MTLLQATAVTERWGATHYGHLSGILSAPVMLATALGPFIGAALASLLNGYAAMVPRARGIAAVAAALPLPQPCILSKTRRFDEGRNFVTLCVLAGLPSSVLWGARAGAGRTAAMSADVTKTRPCCSAAAD